MSNEQPNLVRLKNVRIAFPELYTPTEFVSNGKPDGKPKYRAVFLIKKDDPQVKDLMHVISEVAKAKWQDKGAQVIKSITGNRNKFFLQDGDNSTYDGFEGCYSMSTSRPDNKGKPRVVDQFNNELSADSGRPYGGCYVNATFEVFASTNTGNGIYAGLRGVQFVKDGEAFGAGAPPKDDEFDAIEEGATDSLDDILGGQ